MFNLCYLSLCLFSSSTLPLHFFVPGKIISSPSDLSVCCFSHSISRQISFFRLKERKLFPELWICVSSYRKTTIFVGMVCEIGVFCFELSLTSMVLTLRLIGEGWGWMMMSVMLVGCFKTLTYKGEWRMLNKKAQYCSLSPLYKMEFFITWLQWRKDLYWQPVQTLSGAI